MRIAPASDSSIFVGFGDAITPEHHAQVMTLLHRLIALAHPHIRNLHPAYSSVLIDFDPLYVSYEQMRNILGPLIAQVVRGEANPPNLVEIPVCYDPTFGPDLEFVSSHTRLSLDQIIATHTAGKYLVYFLGFTPGFGYLGPLAPELNVPRHFSPRKRVAAGSIGLAGIQTAVYPSDSPGGWQIIGRTPLRMFDPTLPQPSRLQPGDDVRFRSISREEFVSIAAEEHHR
jgi:inhibitor of KinA